MMTRSDDFNNPLSLLTGFENVCRLTLYRDWAGRIASANPTRNLITSRGWSFHIE